jgi:ATP-dependent Lon protease
MARGNASEKEDVPIHRQEPLPVLPLRNAVVFPGMVLPLRVGRARSVAAVEAAMAKHGGTLVLVALKEDVEEPTSAEIYKVGTLAHIEKLVGTRETGFQIIVRGLARATLESIQDAGDYLQATPQLRQETPGADAPVLAALLKSLKELSLELLALVPADTTELEKLVHGIEDLSLLSHLAAGNADAPLEQKQALLEQDELKARVLELLEILQRQKDALAIQGEIRERLTRKLGKHQRESILRQQLDAIREELGETGPDNGNLAEKIEKAGMPEAVKKIALDELRRLETMGNASPEAHVIRTYIDWLCAMPWTARDSGRIELTEARRILEADHYGLEKVKQRILQTLAVMKLKADGKSPILLLVGPPGVGKTSLAQSIASALGRKFVRASLGGVRDDAEIRGHRRTYVGALPGRIVQGLKRAGTRNPVFLLDEIDKLGRSFQGDPAGALLEVLDPEQNATFHDHYLDVPFDLSEVLFIATANTLETIPAPLLDRMEVIELSGYTTAEKLHIAKRHLWPKQVSDHGLREEQVRLGDDVLLDVISSYTREAGVRDLKRQLAAICRFATERVVSGDGPVPFVVDAAAIEEALGRRRFQTEVADRVAEPGVVTGLAWTPHGGEILFVEATKMPGSGKLTLTGQLGDVMRESAQLALSLVRSRLHEAAPLGDGEPEGTGKRFDVHVHVPSGAIPKDGPSAGVAMLTTLASMASGRRVNPKLAMTGEITLRGAVLPVGGVREKVIAAHRAGIEHVILPKRNEPDLRDVPQEVRDGLKFSFVETVDDVLEIALGIAKRDASNGLDGGGGTLPAQPPAADGPAITCHSNEGATGPAITCRSNDAATRNV